MKDTTTTTPIYRITQETTSVVKNMVLEGVKVLKAEKFTRTYKVKRKLDPKTGKPIFLISKDLVNTVVKPMTFDLGEVTPKELAVYRRNGISSFVLKIEGKLYHATIPDCISFVSSAILGTHQCAAVGNECNRLSAASDEQGGCAKVRERSQGIERYPWITCGYETFNTKQDSFIVINCLHYEKCPPRPNHSADTAKRTKLDFAQFV